MHRLKGKIPEEVLNILKEEINTLRPAQEKAISAGLLHGKNLLICTPTASGKTLIAELAASKAILENHAKAIYIVPLKALASEKFKNFKKRYGMLFKVELTIGDLDTPEPYLAEKDLIVCTAEKLDSLLRHSVPWLCDIRTLIIDEIHLINDTSRGPTLEILITLLRQTIKNVQIIGLSATIGNPEELAEWLGAELVIDDWRPVELKKGILLNGVIEFY